VWLAVAPEPAAEPSPQLAHQLALAHPRFAKHDLVASYREKPGLIDPVIED